MAAIRWKINFVSIQNTHYTLEIYDINWPQYEYLCDVDEERLRTTEVDSSHLYLRVPAYQLSMKGVEHPFVTNEDDSNDFYTPVRTQTGYMRFIVENPDALEEMMPKSAVERPVILRNAANQIEWMGFLGMEQYTQPWDRTPYEIEVPVVSVMEAMKGVQFTQEDGYTSLFDLMRTINEYCPVDIVMHAPVETPIYDICVNNNNFRTFLSIAERGERSTTNVYECMSVYEAVEEFCKFYGLSLHEYKTDMYFIVHDQDNVTYEDIDIEGYTEQSQYGYISLTALTICGDSNTSEFSKPYRRIVGTFEIGRDKASELFKLDDFLTQFSVNGKYPESNPWYLLFNGNAEVLPYAQGTQQVTPIGLGIAATYTGGQLIKMSEYKPGTTTRGRSYKDCILVYSTQSKVGTPETAMKILPARKVYINTSENTVLHISGDVHGDNGNDTTGDRLYLKLKIGNYWLRSYISSGSTYTSYLWTTEESIAYLKLHDHSISMYEATDNIPVSVASTLENYSGFAVMMPPVSAGYYDISIELLANAQESTSEFGEFSGLGQMIQSFEVEVMRGNDVMNIPTPNMDSNSIIRVASDIYSDDYEVSSNITTRRGAQFGVGAALTLQLGYTTEQYDQTGIVRRAALIQEPRKVLEVDVRGKVQPMDQVEYNNSYYAILAQSIDWRDEVNTIKMIKTD